MGASSATVENAYLRGRIEQTDRSQEQMMKMLNFQQKSHFMNTCANRMLGMSACHMQQSYARFGY
ncbi:hypothetical protein ACNI65_17400 [Roseateles sp. So40a]|uniref:hypothetical protein n=1 Tax=Roseateles sp. So40a TaxID=3400226 RepID=UPI003A89F4CE